MKVKDFKKKKKLAAKGGHFLEIALFGRSNSIIDVYAHRIGALPKRAHGARASGPPRAGPKILTASGEGGGITPLRRTALIDFYCILNSEREWANIA